MTTDMQTAARDLIREHAADESALERLDAAEQVKPEIADQLDREQWAAAVTAVAEGTSLATIGQRLGLSRWAVAKRWPCLTTHAKTHRWWYLNALTWTNAVDDLAVAEQHTAAEALMPDEIHHALEQILSLAASYRQSGDWTLLPATRPPAETLLAHAPSEDVEHHKSRDWVSALLADFDQTASGRKGPELEVTRETITAATQDRISREGRSIGSPNGKSR